MKLKELGYLFIGVLVILLCCGGPAVLIILAALYWWPLAIIITPFLLTGAIAVLVTICEGAAE